MYSMMTNLGIKDEETVRLFLGITNGIVSQQNALNPGGRDWRPLMDRGIDLFLDHVGVRHRSCAISNSASDAERSEHGQLRKRGEDHISKSRNRMEAVDRCRKLAKDVHATSQRSSS
jgi:hypothetical protein